MRVGQVTSLKLVDTTRNNPMLAGHNNEIVVLKYHWV